MSFKLSEILNTTSIDDVVKTFQETDQIQVSWKNETAILDVSGQETDGYFHVQAGSQEYHLGANILARAILETQAIDKVIMSSLEGLSKLKQAFSRQKSLATK